MRILLTSDMVKNVPLARDAKSGEEKLPVTTVLEDADIDRLPAMALALEALEPAFAVKTQGGLIAPPRHRVSFPPFGDLVFTIGGQVAGAPVAGFRVYDKFSGPRHTQLIAVWSPRDAALQGVVVGERLGPIRTGAIGGIAIRHMSAPGASRVGLLGAGPHARTQLQAAAAVRALEQVRVYNRTEEKRRAFAAEMEAELGIAVEPAATAREAVAEADIVICATSSPTPVIEAGWLRPGVHVNTIGPKTVAAHELDPAIAEIAGCIATDSPEQTSAYDAPFFLSGTSKAAQMVDLAKIVSGEVPARRSARDTTLFCSVGLAGTEVIVASRLLAAAGA